MGGKNCLFVFWAAARSFCSVQRLAGGGKSISKQLRAGRRAAGGRQRAVAVAAAGNGRPRRVELASSATGSCVRRAAAALLSATLL